MRCWYADILYVIVMNIINTSEFSTTHYTLHTKQLKPVSVYQDCLTMQTNIIVIILNFLSVMPDWGRGYLVSLARPISLQARGRVWRNACISLFTHYMGYLMMSGNVTSLPDITGVKFALQPHPRQTDPHKKLAACAAVHVLIVVHNQNLTI